MVDLFLFITSSVNQIKLLTPEINFKSFENNFLYIDNLANRQINQRLKDKLNNPNGGIGIKLGTAYGTDFQLGNENLFMLLALLQVKKVVVNIGVHMLQLITMQAIEQMVFQKMHMKCVSYI